MMRKIDVTIDVEVADCERALQICANDIVTEHLPHSRDAFAHNEVQIGVPRRLHAATIG
jgi:hypothetical protein